jgi:cysteine synthase A
MKLLNILESIGDTPHLKINRLFDQQHEVWLKLERANPGGSIKDRVAKALIEDAEARGLLQQGSVIIEATSGNTGIGLALVAAVKGYRLILTMPESMSLERRRLLSVYGAELVLTPRELGMKGAIARAAELAQTEPNAWQPLQFDNPANPNTHAEFTAQEILADFPEGLDYLITGVGTGGHLTGVGRELKKQWPALKVIAVEPSASPVISGGVAGPHPLQGIGAGFIPANLDKTLLDGVIAISKEEAFAMAARVAKTEGLFAGISTGASLAAVEKHLATLTEPTRVLSFNYDTGERYLSVDGLFA